FSLTNTASTTATKVDFVKGPSNGTAGTVLAPPVTVQVQDASGKAVSGPFTVTLTLGTNPGNATLGGTTTVTTDASGLATFSDLKVSSPGLGYTLVASSAGLPPAPSSAFSQFATQLVFTRQPSDGNVNTPTNAPAGVTVEAQDSNGRPLEGIPITMAIGNNPGGGVLGGTTTLMTGADGRATFSNLTINKQGRGYTLVASSSTAGPST